MRFRPAVLVLAISVVWGTAWIPDQMVAGQGTPVARACLLYAVAAVILAIVASLAGLAQPHRVERFRADEASRVRESRASFLLTSLMLGLTMFAAPSLLLFWSAGHGAGPWTPLLYAGMPLGLSLAAGELKVASIVGLGAMLALLNGSLPISAAKIVWALPILASVALQGWSLVYAKRNLAAAGSLAGVAVQFAVAALALGAATALWEAPQKLAAPGAWSGSALVCLAFVAALGMALAYPLYYYLLRTTSPAQLSVSQWLQTLIAVGEGAWLLRQRPGWMMASAAAALAGCSWVILSTQTSIAPAFSLFDERESEAGEIERP